MEKQASKNNGKKIKKYKLLHTSFLIGTAIAAFYCARNLWGVHKFDKYVNKFIEVAANVPSAGDSIRGSTDLNPDSLSMEYSLKIAKDGRANEKGEVVGGLGVSRLENTGIIWKTPITEVKTLEKLLDKSIQRSDEIQCFKDSFSSGSLDPNAPQWVKESYEKINPEMFQRDLGINREELTPRVKAILLALSELAESEYGQRIANEYEALNTTVSGGTRLKAKNLKETHRSLLDTLEKAGGWRSIIRLQADNYKQTYANVFIGYLMANMGDLDAGLKYFHQAKELMDRYPDNKNLAIWRKTEELKQGTIKGLINSSIIELDSLNKDSSKYSAGWWKRLKYYNQSIGGQTNPSISDMAEIISGRYMTRGLLSGTLAGAFFYIAGKYGKKYKLAKGYEVPLS